MQNINMKKRLIVAAGLLGLGASTAGAANFDVTAEVENSLDVTVVQGMNTGTIFATEALEQNRSTLVLEPDGSIAPGDKASTGDDVVLLSLGGQQAARASVAAESEFTVTLPDAEVADLTIVNADASTNGIPLTITGGDPAVAELFLVNFRLDDAEVGNAAVVQNPGGGGPFTFGVTPDFGETDVEFGIGATISTDDSDDTATPGAVGASYEQGTYEGTFEVTAEF